jgi:glyoxylase-like metal-dependent hydrolase (beta-lactamase superfamily II)
VARTKRAALSLMILLAPGALFAQPAQDFSKVQIETLPVAAGVHMLVGAGGNIAVSTGADGVLIVDDQYAPMHPKIVAAVEALKSGPVRFVLNTHWHLDHTGGNELFGKGGALLVAHDAARKRLAAGQFMKFFNREIPPAPPVALPDMTFGDDVTFHWNGDEIFVLHVPEAHTDGDAIVHFRRANVVHMGDVFTTGYPFIDAESGGTLAGIIAGSDAALALADASTRVIPGHGPLAGREELLRYRDMLVASRDRIAKAIAEGQSLEALLAAKPLADFDAAYGNRFITPEVFLRSAHASLEAERK